MHYLSRILYAISALNVVVAIIGLILVYNNIYEYLCATIMFVALVVAPLALWSGLTFAAIDELEIESL